jgi:hypothetical protein
MKGMMSFSTKIRPVLETVEGEETSLHLAKIWPRNQRSEPEKSARKLIPVKNNSEENIIYKIGQFSCQANSRDFVGLLPCIGDAAATMQRFGSFSRGVVVT